MYKYDICKIKRYANGILKIPSIFVINLYVILISIYKNFVSVSALK